MNLKGSVGQGLGQAEKMRVPCGSSRLARKQAMTLLSRLGRASLDQPWTVQCIPRAEVVGHKEDQRPKPGPPASQKCSSTGGFQIRFQVPVELREG